MNHFLLGILSLFFLSSYYSAQDTLFYENFEDFNGTFILNTNDLGSEENGVNHWVINNSYSGGDGTTDCLGFQFPFSVVNTSTQASFFENAPESNYMHISSFAAENAGIFNASFIGADNICTPEETYFSSMSFDLNTADYTEVGISFYFLNASSLQFEAQVYYSTDMGQTWQQAGDFISPNANDWTLWTWTHPFLNSQNTLRFGFQFKNAAQLGAEDPPLSIDEIVVSGIKECEDTGIQLQSFLCEGDSIFLQGAFQNQSGTFIDTLQTVDGCDSVVINSISFNPSYFNPIDSIQLCQGDSIIIAGSAIYTSGYYTENFQTAFGCDSISQYQILFEEIEVEINWLDNVLIASQGFSEYQWIDCNTGLEINEANSSFFEPQNSGTYAVQVSNGNCLTESDCFEVMINSIQKLESFVSLFPNPTQDLLYIDSQFVIDQILIYNDLGQIVKGINDPFLSRKTIDMTSWSKGHYIIEIISGNSIAQTRIVKI